jgi:hypothetical protein
MSLALTHHPVDNPAKLIKLSLDHSLTQADNFGNRPIQICPTAKSVKLKIVAANRHIQTPFFHHYDMERISFLQISFPIERGVVRIHHRVVFLFENPVYANLAEHLVVDNLSPMYLLSILRQILG